MAVDSETIARAVLGEGGLRDRYPDDDEFAAALQRLAGDVGGGEDDGVEMSSARAPVGGVTVQGRRYKGGSFIPGAVLAEATPEEREAIESGEGGEESDSDDAQDALALARWYAVTCNTLEALGMAAQTEQIAADASEELEGSGWELARSANGLWTAADVSADEEDADGAEELTLSLEGWTLATTHQVGETWKGNSGRWFTKRKDGRVVPAKNPNATAPGAKKRVAERHAAKPADRAALAKRLDPYKAAPPGSNPWSHGNAGRIAKAFVQHHGEGAATRIEELTEHVEGALNSVQGDDWKAERARRILTGRLRELHLALAALPKPEEAVKELKGDLKPRIVTARPEHTKPADPEAVPESLRKFLVSPDGSDHQLQGAAKAIAAIDGVGGFLLADGAGAGKTRQMLAVAQAYALRGKKALLVAPAGIIKPDWKGGSISGSVGKDGEAMGVSLQLNKGDRPIGPGEVHVTTYEQLAAMKDQIDADTVVIFDEAHGLKNAESARSQHGAEVAARAMGVVYGTATPADSALDLAYLFRTKLFGDEPWARVKKRFDPDRVGAAEALKNTAEMFEKLTAAGVMVKREISLDGVEARFDHVELSAEGKAALESIKAGTSTKDRAQVLMKQRFAQEKLKIPHAVDAVSEELAQGRRVVIFVAGVGGGEEGPGTAGQLREALARAGVSPDEIAELHGGEGGGGREVVEAFQKGTAKVLITTAQSGGTGHNLDDTEGDAPRTQIILTAPFSAIDNAQIWGRTHRLTTRSKSRMRYLFADTDVDRWNADLIRGKVKSLGAIVGGEVPKQDVPEFGNKNEAKGHDPKAVEDTTLHHAALIAGPHGQETVKIPDLVDRIVKDHPGMTRQQAHDELHRLQADDKLTLQVVNDRHLEPRADEMIESPRGLLGYVQLRQKS